MEVSFNYPRKKLKPKWLSRHQVFDKEEEVEREALLKKLEAGRQLMEQLEEVDIISFLKWKVSVLIIKHISGWYDRVLLNSLDTWFVDVFILLTSLEINVTNKYDREKFLNCW